MNKQIGKFLTHIIHGLIIFRAPIDVHLATTSSAFFFIDFTKGKIKLHY